MGAGAQAPQTQSGRQKYQGQVRDFAELAENGTKGDWFASMEASLRKKAKVKMPEIDTAKFKFGDYGYRQFVELLVESDDFFRMATEIETVKDFKVVSMNSLLVGDEYALRALGAFCDLLYNKEARYNPVSSTDHQYLNMILDCAANSQKEGNETVWNIATAAKTLKVKARFDKNDKEWVYSIA